MTDLPSWAVTALEALYYAVFGPFLVLYAAFAVFLFLSPLAFAFWGKAPPIDRIWSGIAFCLLVGSMALAAL